MHICIYTFKIFVMHYLVVLAIIVYIFMYIHIHIYINTDIHSYVYRYLSQELYDYLDACIMVPTSIEEAYRKFDELSAKHIEKLRKFTKQIQDARLARDSELIKTNLKLYDEDLEKYIPILMAQVYIYLHIYIFIYLYK
jgi:hypothetical protein